MSAVAILDVFPRHFDQNGDSGNLLALRRRLEWSGFEVEVVRVDPGDTWPAAAPDFVLIGGGSIPAQRDALAHLVAERERVVDWVAAGTGYLAVAGGYALSATSLTLPGETQARAGLGVFAAQGTCLAALHSGPVVIQTGEYGVLHGFVNLAQRVVLDDSAQALGVVEVGPWGVGEPEGATLRAAVGAHAHGPLLPKNPAFADAFIRAGLSRRALADEYRVGERHRHVDALARQARASLARRLGTPVPD